MKAGTYYESLIVNKTLSFIGENKETTIICGNGEETVMDIEANNVNVTGLTVKNPQLDYNNGIVLDKVRNCRISGNKILNSFFGIALFSCSDLYIMNNYVTNNHFGIGGDLCSNCTITGNNAIFNEDGIAIDDSSKLRITSNIIKNNKFGFASHYPSSNNSISSNTITDNFYGIWLYYSGDDSITGNCIINNYIVNNEYGIWQYFSPHTRITRNKIENRFFGIKLDSCLSDNIIADNNITANSRYGIWLYSSSNNTVIGNTIADNGYGLRLDSSSNTNVTDNIFDDNGMFVLNSFGNKVYANFVNGRPLSYLEGATGQSVEDAGQAILVNCTNARIVNIESTKTTIGIELYATSNSEISGSNLTDNIYGMMLYSSPNNKVTENNIANNQWGVTLTQSLNNSFYHNNFINNTNQVITDISANIWDNGYPSGGNYWSTCDALDLYCSSGQNETGSDGVGDSAFVIDGKNRDRYPIMVPFGRDVAVTSVELFKTVLRQGNSATINVTVENQGFVQAGFKEFFSISISVNQILIETKTVSLLAGASLTFMVRWNTSGFAMDNYSITVFAQFVPNEKDKKDNISKDKWIVVTILGDVNGDFKIDGKDIAIIAKAFDTRLGQLLWNPNADVNNDLRVDGKDIAIAAKNYNK